MAGLFGSSGSADSDLEGSKAPLIEHLIELRNRLMYSVIALFICFIGAYLVAEHIYAFWWRRWPASTPISAWKTRA